MGTLYPLASNAQETLSGLNQPETTQLLWFWDPCLLQAMPGPAPGAHRPTARAHARALTLSRSANSFPPVLKPTLIEQSPPQLSQNESQGRQCDPVAERRAQASGGLFPSPQHRTRWNTPAPQSAFAGRPLLARVKLLLCGLGKAFLKKSSFCFLYVFL